MIANYHTHTFRCGHAEGADRDYVEAALARGLKTLGFSDHVPMPFPDGREDPFRVPAALLEDYVNSVLALREEYAGRIEILLGFETEYYPDLFDALKARLRPYPVDYLLLAMHFNDSDEDHYNPRPRRDEAWLVKYVDRSLEGLATGCFSCFAHPDLPYYTGPERIYRREMRRLCLGAKRMDVPLEINALGLFEGKCYPSPVFWEIASELGCRCVLGCDAHAPQDVADPEQLRAVEAFAARFGLRPEQTLTLRKPF